MLTGRNPWRLAVTADPCFNAYRTNRDFLQTVLPISQEANDILKRIFHLYPSRRIRIRDLKQEISAVQTFFISDEELHTAPEAVQKVAEFCGAVLSPSQSLDASPQRNSTGDSDDSAEEVVILTSRADRTGGLQLDDVSATSNLRAEMSTSDSEDDSKGPITPEARPVQPIVEVPDLPDEEQITGTPVIQFHPVSPPEGPRHRAPSSAASKPPPRRVGRQLFKRAVRRLKRLSESASSLSS
jgi:hypothetical protein